MLAVDVGNTTISVARFSRRGIAAQTKFSAAKALAGEELVAALGEDAPEKIYLASVNPAGADNFLAAAGVFGEVPLVSLNERVEEIMPHSLPSLDGVGVDRLLAAFAAKAYFPKEPVVVAQAGTALVVDLVGEDGKFAGGVIMPGPQMWLDSLSAAAGLAGEYDIGEIKWGAKKPGKTTPEVVLSGAGLGLLGAAKEGIRLLAAFQGKIAPRLVYTGGWAEKLLLGFPGEHKPELVLDGIVIFANQEKANETAATLPDAADLEGLI